jgi:hydrophobe/amphiphile efflux-1 (HAE1) family protein
MALSDYSIKRPVFAWMLFFGLIIFGVLSLSRLGVSQLPDVDFPIVSVSLSLEGASPEVMESAAVDPVENTVMTIAGVRSVTSASRRGSGSVTIEFDLGKDIDVAMQEVQNKLSQLGHVLPKDMDPPTISKSNPEDQPIIWLGVRSATMSRKDLMGYVRDELQSYFSTIPGVGDVMITGYVEPSMRIWLDPKKLRDSDITASDVINTIQNQHGEVPGGYLTTKDKESNVRTLGEAKSADEFGDLVIGQRGGRPSQRIIRLKEIGRVEDGLADIRQISRTMGQTAVGLGIRKQRGSNAVSVAQLVRKKIESLKPILPNGVELGVNFDSTKFIENSIKDMEHELVVAALLTGLICWLFLGSISSTINILLAIPTSIVGAFTVIYFLGFTLNTFTLLALTLSIGIVVDDAIMMLENIVRHREMGKSRLKAALDGAREISSAAMVTTVAIVAIFLPVVFIQGAIGRFFFQFGIAISVTVLLSLLEALTITPMRCSQMLGTTDHNNLSAFGKKRETILNGLTSHYRALLSRLLARPKTVIFGAFLFFLASLFTVKFINKEFLPPQDQSMFLMRAQTPVGSSLEFTDGKFREIEDFLSKHAGIERYFVSIGQGDVNTGIAFVTLKPKDKRPVNPKTGRPYTQNEIMADARAGLSKIKDVRVIIQDLSSRGFTASRGFPVEFTVIGADWEKLATYSKQIMEEMTKTGLVTDVDSDFKVGMPEVQVYPDRQSAAVRAVNTASIGQTVNALIGGVVAGRYTKNSRRYDIRVRLEADARTQPEQINDLFVRNAYGESIPLKSVVKIDQKPQPQLINRRDRQRSISVFANVAPGKSQAQAMAAADEIAKKILPDGYHTAASGNTQSMKESFQSLIVALFLGIAVAYMVLASQFNSFIDPVTILLALPFSITGAFVTLLVTGQSINIYSLIGILLLMGLVKKNSILLVEFTNQIREQQPDLSVTEALVQACPVRLRPILMTSFATIAGAVPSALGLGEGSETRVPMAATIIGGVLVSTVLSLLVVPCGYLLFSRFERRKQHQNALREMAV